MSQSFKKLQQAQTLAWDLFELVKTKNLIQPGITEKDLSESIFKLAKEMHGIEKYWHKRIVRAGKNTLLPYYENPPNLTIQEDDILFLDFGPIFQKWEADIGVTFALGSDPDKNKLARDVELAWNRAKFYFDLHPDCTGAELYKHVASLAKEMGWDFTAEMAGHIIGEFPHERLEKADKSLYIHPENDNPIRSKDAKGKDRHWILEIHFVDEQKEIGGFFEQLLG